MIKSKKLTKTKLNLGTKTNKTAKNKFNHHENLQSTRNTSIKYVSDEEYYNFSDSSLELFETFKPKSRKNKDSEIKSNSNVVFDVVDLTNESDTKSKQIKKINFLSDLSVYNISSSSNESFKSTTSVLSNISNIYNGNVDSSITIQLENNLPDSNKKNLYNITSMSKNKLVKHSEFQNNYSTPKEKHIQNNQLTESATLLDKMYGKEWRSVDGVIKNFKEKKKLIDDDFEYYNEWNDENILKSNHNEIENSSSHELSTKTNKYLQDNDIEIEVNDTSIILESFSLSVNSENLTDDKLNIDPPKVLKQVNLKTTTQHYTNEYNSNRLNDLKQISKSKTPKNYDDAINTDKQSKIPIASNLEAKLSFLSSLSCFTGSMKCDPDAEIYKLKFKKNKDSLVSVLFKLFNAEIFDNKLPADMNFKWNARLRTTAGACFNKRSVKINENLECERISRIELSSKIIDTTERLRDTLIHELCHAACWIFNGISEGHGPSWKSWANKAMQRFPELPIIKRCHSYDIQTKFTYKCTKCCYSFGRHSKSLNLVKKRCGYCYGEFELIVNTINYNQMTGSNLPVVYTDPLKELYNLNDVQEKPKLPKKPSKFALFVKENYSRVKQKNRLLKHGEIMKLLGSQFATTKILTPDEIFDKLRDS